MTSSGDETPLNRRRKPSRKPLYDRDRLEKNIFWDAYCEIEKIRNEETQELANYELEAQNALASSLSSKGRGFIKGNQKSAVQRSNQVGQGQFSQIIGSSSSFPSEFSWAKHDPRFMNHALLKRGRSRFHIFSSFFIKIWFFIRSFINMFRDRDIFDNEGLLEINDPQLKAEWREKRKKKYLEDREFRLFFIEKTKFVCLSVLTFAMCTVLLAVIMTIESLQHVTVEGQDLRLSVFGLVVFPLIWVLYLGLCLFFYVAFSYFRHSDSDQSRNTWYNRWIGIGRLILYSRVMIVCYNIIHSIMSSRTCYNYDYHSRLGSEQIFNAYLISMSMDIFNVIILSVMPFPWPWAVYLNAIQYLEELLRVYSCKDIVFGGDKFGGYINTCMMNVAISLMITGIFTSYSFERCVRSSYKNIQDQNNATQEKMILVNMLCRDVKAPTQQFVQIFQSMEGVLSRTPIELRQYTQSLQGITKSVNLIVDDLLFLVRVEEGRFSYNCETKVHIPTMLSTIYEALKIATMLGTEEIVDDQMFESSLREDGVTTEYNCLRVILYYGLLAAVELVSSPLPKPGAPRPAASTNNKIHKNIPVHNTNANPTAMESGKNPLVGQGISSNSDPHTPMPKPNRPTVVRAPPKSILIKFERIIPPRGCLHFFGLNRQKKKKIDSELSHTEHFYMLKISIIVRDPQRSFAAMGLTKNSLLESLCIISQRIVDSCGGSFALYENRIEFTLLCRENMADEDGEDDTMTYDVTATTSGLNAGNIANSINRNTLNNSSAHPSINNGHSKSFNWTSDKENENSQNRASEKLSKSNSFLVPASLLAASKSSHGKVSSSSSSSNEFYGGKAISISYDDIEAQLTSYIPKQVYIYSSEAALIGLLKDVVEALPGGSDLLFHTDLSAAQLKIHSIVFTQSINACLEVREKKFSGKIVLFSERLSYLDESERRHFDYGIALPCSEEEIVSLLRWLYIRCLKESAIMNGGHNDEQQIHPKKFLQASPKKAVGAMPKEYSSLALQDIAIFTSNVLSQLRTFTTMLFGSTNGRKQDKSRKGVDFTGVYGATINNDIDWWVRFVNISQVMIPRNRLDSFGQWKLVNPGKSWLHHTYQFEASVLVVLVMSFVSWQSGVITIQYIGPLAFYFLSLCFRRLFYHFIMKYTSINFMTWWKLCCYWDCFFTFISFLGEFLNMTTHGIQNMSIGVQKYTPDNIDTLTFSEFLTVRRGELSGSESMFMLVYFPGWMKLTVEFVPWPVCYAAVITYFIRSIFLISNILVHFMTRGLFGYMIWLLSSLCIVVAIIQYFNEGIYREEFTELYELIKSKDFLDKCLQCSRRGLFVPMKKLDSTFKTLMKDVVGCAIKDSFFIGYELLSKFEQLKMNVLISKELSYSLRVADGKFFRRPVAAIFNAMRDIYIRDVVQNVCSSFMLSHNHTGFIRDNEINCSIADLSLSIYFHLHPSLTMVKVDEELFAALLCNGCRTAIARIQETMQSSPKDQGYVHQLLIWIEPGRQAAVQKFTDVKVLEVFILDTGMIVNRKQDGEDDEYQQSEQGDEMEDLEEIVPFFNVLNGESRLERVKGALFHDIRRSSSLRYQRMKALSEDEDGEIKSKGNQHALSTKKFLYTGGQAICDKYMKFFMLPLRFQTGRVRHAQFRSFQRFGVPYMLCRDSNKYDQWFIASDDQSMTLINHAKKLQFYSKYLTSYGDNLDLILHQQARRMQKDALAASAKTGGSAGSSLLRSGKFSAMSLPPPSKLSTKSNNNAISSRKRRRKFEGIVTIYAKLGGELSQAILENKRIFNQLGWKCRMSPLKDLPSMSSLLDVDCVIMESDITTRAWSYDFRDLIHYLRANGFQGVIIVAVTKTAVSLSANAPQFAAGQSIIKPGTSTAQGPVGSGFRDALATETPDMFLAVPFGSFEVKNIVKAIEERILSLFISPA